MLRPRAAGVTYKGMRGVYAAPTIKKLVESGIPVMGVCLGHQMLGLALGAKTMKMSQGHHGANHPVQDKRTGKVEIVSMNHGFAIDRLTLPKGVKAPLYKPSP